MPDIITQLDRISELSKLLLQMNRETDDKKFWQLQQRWNDIVAMNRLEDELNASHAN